MMIMIVASLVLFTIKMGPLHVLMAAQQLHAKNNLLVVTSISLAIIAEVAIKFSLILSGKITESCKRRQLKKQEP
jgi:hypothetical protein